jgi:lipid II:glycine glycyltransferase (peptidoglycan interpeptide bridge formation enzyme)
MNLIVLEEPNEKWDQFVSLHSDLIFHTSIWWKVLKEGYGCQMRYLAWEDGEKWHTALPGMIVGNRFFKVFYSLIPYGGFIGNREHITKILNLANDWAKKEKFQRIQIVDLAIKKREDLPDFNCVESYRHLLELKDKSPDQIWKNYDEGLKRNIRKALKSDLSFEKIRSREEVDQFYKLYLDSMKRNKALAKYPLELFHKIYDFLVPEFADIFFVKHRNQPIAGMVVIYSKDIAHYFHGGSDTEYLHLRPNDLLFHQAIQIVKEKEISYFDFLGSDKKFLSLIQFKDKWGTQREELLNFHKDLGLVRPFLFKIALSLAQTSIGSAIHRKLKSI